MLQGRWVAGSPLHGTPQKMPHGTMSKVQTGDACGPNMLLLLLL